MKEVAATILVAFVVFIFLLVAILWAGAKVDDEFAQRCHAKGGGVVELYGPNICVTDDGRIIPVED